MKQRALFTLLLMMMGAAAHAQEVISERTEMRTVYATPIAPGTVSAVRDGPALRANVTGPAQIPGTRAVTQQTTIRVLAFQIPNFNPEDLYTHSYHVGMFSASGNGSGTIRPNDSGYAEFEQSVFPGETPMETFLYSVHVDSGEVRVFIDVDDMSVNQAAQVLTNLALNAVAQRGERLLDRNRRLRPPEPPPAVGDERKLGLFGDYLTLDDLQEQIFEQTRCDVARVEGDYHYALVGCN